MIERVCLLDVSMRDGLQDEPKIVETSEKVQIAHALIDAGIEEIEATSFVHPRWVPQQADADVLVPMLPKTARLSALIMNLRGVERAIAAFDAGGFARGSYDLAFVASASPRHNAANNNRTIDETMNLFKEVAAAARREAVSLRGGIACSFVSPWPEEHIEAETVERIARTYVEGGCKAITLADTVGRADPRTVARRIRQISSAVSVPLALHLHDSYGFGLANVYAGLENGVREFEGALAGLGGCPWAPGAPGNLDLEKLCEFLQACGFDTGVDANGLRAAAARIRLALDRGRPLEREAAVP